MPREKAIAILLEEASQGKLDKRVVNELIGLIGVRPEEGQP
jgi:hypothetical protein